MRIVKWQECDRNEQLEILRRPPLARNQSAAVATILETVRRDGDEAVRRFTLGFDRCRIDDLEVPSGELRSSDAMLSDPVRGALLQTIAQLEAFHRPQLRSAYEVTPQPGIVLRREVRPIRTVGFYIPGGTAPLVSTVLMLAVPARLAGCTTMILCTPPRADGSVDPSILAAAQLVGISRVFRVGGAQAIAAMAYGTESIPRVDKIFGPGNSWVTEAKAQVGADPCGAAIDMPAGPSEVMVVGDASSDARFIASDLLSQAEHGADSQVVLIALDPALPERVQLEMERLLPTLGRADIARQSLEHSIGIVVDSRETALKVIDRYAPEHLVLQVDAPESWVERIACAGSVFCGPYTPEAAGDYATGTNHVLPTGGWARSLSGLSVESFQRTMSVQTLSRAGLERIAATVGVLSGLEGLDAHGLAIAVRLKPSESSRGES